MRLRHIAMLLVVGALTLVAAAYAGDTGSKTHSDTPASAAKPAAPPPQDNESLRLEGEKRFRTNCGRCHMTPHKFPPRMMATIIRHMRVRAMITDEDMKLILRYMTQ